MATLVKPRSGKKTLVKKIAITRGYRGYSSYRQAAKEFLRKGRAVAEAASLASLPEVYSPVRKKKKTTKRGSAKTGKAATKSVAQESRLAAQLVATVAQNSADVNVLCDTYGLRREELGRLTGFSLRALADWAGGKLPSQPAYRRLHEVRRLLDALAELVAPEGIPQWLRTPNPAFANLPPLQVIESGEIDRLWEMVHERAAGVAQ